jgi:hypothetical protein
LQVLLKDLFIWIVTFALAGSFLATEANMHDVVALFPLDTTHGFGLQPETEVEPTARYVNAGQTIGVCCVGVGEGVGVGVDVGVTLTGADTQDIDPELG